jgi:S1-C subfamily serine protease
MLVSLSSSGVVTNLLLAAVVLAAQQAPPSAPSRQRVAHQTAVVHKTPSQILEESRGAVAVIVAGADKSLKLGSGFFVRSSGLLLTNFHVVENAELVGAKLPKESITFWAKTARGFDLDNDLVVLNVELQTHTVRSLSLGDSDNVRVGEPIVVVSNPEGLEQTVSNGLISGIRELDGRKLFQITAPISEGSSGGPVFNERGEVIGVIVSSLESGQNLNFAVPINYAKPMLQAPNAVLISALPKRKIISDESSKNKAVGIPENLPRFWKNTLTGEKTEIRIDGDYIYEEQKERRTLGVAFGEIETHCETKRNGSEWWGKCNHSISAFNLQSLNSTLCSWVTQEVITSVTASRLEGKSQNAPIPEGGCPTPGAGWYEFALIPSD